MAASHSLAHHFATGIFPSIRATLNHILTVDWYYLEALERSLSGREPDPDPERFFRPEEPFGRCADLAREREPTCKRTACRGLEIVV
jgi:uncharacterized damage-inducible protein DinB